ncbi:hypothetical protein [Fimbriimonas ginsengisoli]|nr:hypothetical protein [Fimbriimonas ginsengisoli]
MITLAIIAVLAGVFFFGSGVFQAGGPKSPRKDGKGVTIPGLAEARARDTVCQSNLSQVRQSIMVAQSSGGDELPKSLDELHLPAEVTHCSIGHEAYTYDPATGQVHCPHPGHEKY